MSLDDYVAPVFLTDQAKDLNDRFYLYLNQLVNLYPESKLNPSVVPINSTKTNLQLYNTVMSQMMALQNDYFLYKNLIMQTSHNLLKNVNNIDNQINELDRENKILTSQLNEMANSSQSAEGMLDDTQITRNQIFYGNIILFIIMVSGGYFYYKKVIKAE
jgi:hypothetical protein